MSLFKPVKILRSKSHVNTRFEIRDERTYNRRLIPWLALVMISFGFVDWVSIPQYNFYDGFLLRLSAIVISWVLWIALRGRTRYGTRYFLVLCPYIYCVEYIMLRNDLVFTPYFSGLALLFITATMLFPVRLEIAAIIYTLCIVPIIVYLFTYADGSPTEIWHQATMAIGAALVCSVNSGQVWKETKLRFISTETLARDLGKRGKEVREKVQEILKRKVFESQFSPQVVDAVLNDRSLTREMRHARICTIVIDIQNSTSKSKELKPNDYKAVVEEVFDVFSAACLKWNITLDKFTGDGVQAFAGAPKKHDDDLKRAILACTETINMLKARIPSLEILWQGSLHVRFAVCEGDALVGFMGRGIFKAYTAVGDTVSFTHRLSSFAQPWTIAVHSWSQPSNLELGLHDVEFESSIATGLKGFEQQKFRINIFKPILESNLQIAGRCKQCETPLVFEDGPMGIPRAFCPACELGEVKGEAA